MLLVAIQTTKRRADVRLQHALLRRALIESPKRIAGHEHTDNSNGQFVGRVEHGRLQVSGGRSFKLFSALRDPSTLAGRGIFGGIGASFESTFEIAAMIITVPCGTAPSACKSA